MKRINKNKLRIILHTVVPAALTVFLFIILNYLFTIPLIEKNLIEDRKRLTREITNCAISILSDYNKKIETGALSPEKARTTAMELVSKIRYGPDAKDYLWINDTLPRMIMHPYRKDLDGKDISNFRDPHGKRLFVEMVKTVKKNNEGFVSYMWQWKDDPDRIVPKLSYVKIFKPWGWVVGTGIYINDVNANIALITKKLNIIFIFILCLIIIISTYIIRNGAKNEFMRSQAEKELEKSQRSLRDIIQFLPDAVLVLDQHGRVIAWNQAMEKITGVAGDKIIGKSNLEYSIPFYGEKRQILADLILTPAVEIPESYTVIEREENRIVAEAYTPGLPQGERYLEATAGLLFNENGEVNGAIEIIKDITERKNSEIKLKEAQHYIASIINSMPSVLISIDSDCTITQINNSGEKLTGKPFKEVVGKRICQFLPCLVPDEKMLIEAIEKKRIIEERKIPWNQKGHIHYYHMTAYPLLDNTRDGAVVRIDEITERVNLEEMMIQSEKMLSVGGLAAGMAHEINNPLAGIMGNIELIKNRLTQKNNANQKAIDESGLTWEKLASYLEKRKIIQMLDMAHEGGKRTAEIVRNMLSFARKSERRFSPVSIPKLIDKTVELASTDYDLKKKYDFRHFNIDRHYDPDTPPVYCEESKIQQVLLNLIKNGAEAMSESPKKNTTPTFIFTVQPEAERVRIDISDNGPGLPEDIRRRIFEPFFTTKEVGKGTGLGLSVSYFIITENHKGSMAVESDPGKGTTFTIKLPAK